MDIGSKSGFPLFDNRLFLPLLHRNVSNHMKIVQEIEILEDSITWTVPSGPSRPGSFMISTISSMMLFSPGNI